jgi:hypothetical protein
MNDRVQVIVADHDHEAILAALGWRVGLAKKGQALVIIARAVKGWDVPAVQGTGHHGRPVPKDQLESVLGALDRRAKELGVAAISQDEMARGLPIAQPTATAPLPARPPAGFTGALCGATLPRPPTVGAQPRLRSCRSGRMACTQRHLARQVQ